MPNPVEKIYSQVEPALLLHQINRLMDISAEITDLSDPQEFLQVRPLLLRSGRSFTPHYHLWREGADRVVTQESWIIIRGRIKGSFYDTDGKLLQETILLPGDCAITYRGGHNLTSLDDDTVIYEIKTGPYPGRERDKADINEPAFSYTNSAN